MFFAALGCAVMLGLLYSILGIKCKDPFERNKFENMLSKMHSPTLKILISLLSISLIIFCYTEFQLSFLGILQFFAALIGVFALTCICYILVNYPGIMREEIFLIPYEKYRAPIINNIAVLAVFVILAVGGYIKFTPPSLAILGIAFMGAIGIMWLIHGIVCLIKGICKIIIIICKQFAGIVRNYWQWVLSK